MEMKISEKPASKQLQETTYQMILWHKDQRNQ